MTFLEAVNRVLRSSGVIRGDDDDLLSFSETQHAANSSLAQIAIQDQLISLVSLDILPLEEETGTFEYVSGQRVYQLPSNFVKMSGKYLLEVDATGKSETYVVTETTEDCLRDQYSDYQEHEGTPIHFYFTGAAAKSIGLYPVPNESGQDARFYYEKDVMVESENDTLPFHNNLEAYTFTRMAARHFQILFESTGVVDSSVFERDPLLITTQGVLANLISSSKLRDRY